MIQLPVDDWFCGQTYQCQVNSSCLNTWLSFMRIVLMDSRNIVQAFYIDVRIVCTLHSHPSLTLTLCCSQLGQSVSLPAPATAHTRRDLNQYTPELVNTDIEHPSMKTIDQFRRRYCVIKSQFALTYSLCVKAFNKEKVPL